MTDYNNFDYSNLTGFDYDEVTNKLSCTVAVTVSPTAPTDATTALTAVLDTLNGGATGTISYTFTPNSANYTTASGSISFSVIDAVVTGITLKSAPTKTTYEVGDTLDLTGGKITVSYNNGTSVDIDINGTMIKGFDSTTTGEKTVTVKYSGFTVTFKVTVNKGSFTVEPQPGNMDGAYSINVRFCACASLTFMHSRIEVSKIFVFILSATVSSEALTSLERFALLLYFSPATVSFGF